jgi:hypothetical protein
MERNIKPVTHLDICEVVDEYRIPAFNRYDLNILKPQTQLAAEIANDPDYRKHVRAAIQAIRGTNPKGAAEAIIKTTEYAQKKFGERPGFNAGIEQAAFYARFNA